MAFIHFPAEWAPQSAVQLTWPHKGTDWADNLEEVLPCFIELAKAILEHQDLIVVCADPAEVRTQLGAVDESRLHLVRLPSNDTWARDHGAISVFSDNKPVLLDFTFNGWGEKFRADLDNQISRGLFEAGLFDPTVTIKDEQDFVLEGGSIESDGQGTLLTTAQCLMAPHRNQPMDEAAIEARLKTSLGVDRVLWLRDGYLAGDDTDGHIDMLARFCDPTTIAYVAPPTWEDEHKAALSAMETSLKTFTTKEGHPYRIIPLPMATPVYEGDERLPASYANFLIINGAVLLPVYGLPTDEAAINQLQKAFPDRAIVPIPCSPLIKQHGSLHCLTMQYPDGFLENYEGHPPGQPSAQQ